MDAKDPIVAQLLNLFRVGAITTPSHRPEWDGSKLDGQQRDYVLDRERVLDAIKHVRGIGWQSIHCGDKQLAEAIKENVGHALGVMLEEMRRNEDRML